ncbi:MAG TPA: O-antigen ligase family protein [Vicinamibacterales bacterium]
MSVAPRAALKAGPAKPITKLMVSAVVAVIAWGALAFGAVYPWAFAPLLIACAAIGAAGIVVYRSRRLDRATRVATLAILPVLAAACLQLIPLPAHVLAAVSPGTHEFLTNFDFAYALGADAGSIWHPISLAPVSTALGIAFLAAFTLFLAGLARGLSPSRVRTLAAALVGFGAVLALVGIVQRAVIGDHAWGGMKIYGFWTPQNLLTTPFGPYINKNHFAGWMLMAIPLAVGFAIGRAEHAARHLHGGWRSMLSWLSSPEGGRLQMIVIAAVTMGASLLLTRSRSGVVCLLFSMLLFSAAARRRFGSTRAGWTAFASLAAMVVVVFALAGAELTARIATRMDAVELRKNIWSDSARIIRDFPIAGTGLNTFGTAMIRYQSAQRDQHFQEAHNDYLQVVVEGGLLVAVPAAIALLLMVRAVRRRFEAGEDDSRTHWIRTGAAIGLLSIALQSAVEFSLQMPGNAAMFVVLLAIALHEPRTHA